MHTIKCPNCHTMFELDDSIYMDIVKQVRDEEFEKELEDMATRYQMEKEKVADLLSDDDKKNLRNDICLKKAAKFVTSKAK